MSRVPALSILVPSYNYADFLETALRSLVSCAAEISNSEARVEIIVVDDGSTDRTPEVLAPWVESGDIRAVRQENGGVAAARNTAMEHARGELFMFFDADDVLLPGCVRRTVEFFELHPEVGMFFTNYDIFDSEGIVTASGVDLWRPFRQFPHEVVGADQWVFEGSLTAAILEHGSFMHTSGLTVRREVALETGQFREGYNYGEDDDYWARCAHVCRSAYLDQVLSRKRNHERSIVHDPRQRLNNQRSLLALTELQLEEFTGSVFQTILRRKVLHCAETLVWKLLEAGHRDEARRLMFRYLRQHPWRWQLYKLAAKAALTRSTA